MPPAFSLREQQDRFDQFKHCYNEERPHEALNFATPAPVYVASTRRYPSTIPEPTYGSQFDVRRVRHVGHTKLQVVMCSSAKCCAIN